MIFSSWQSWHVCLWIFGTKGRTRWWLCMVVRLSENWQMGTRISGKNRERAAKDSRKGRERCNGPVHQSPFKVSMLLATIFPSPPFFPFPPFSFLFLSCSSDGRMRCVKRRWTNTLPMPDLIFLMWLQVFPFHRERSAKEVFVAWVARKPPLWPRK